MKKVEFYETKTIKRKGELCIIKEVKNGENPRRKMKQKQIKIRKRSFKYWEHEGFVEFPALQRFFGKGSPNLEVIAIFDKMGYDLISESYVSLIFKKRK